MAQAPNNFLLCKARSHVYTTEAFWRSPPENNWKEKSRAHLGFPESSCLLPQFCARPFQFVQAGFHTVHPTGKLPDIILVTCPLRESSFQLTERDVEGHRLYREARVVSALATPPAGSAQGDQEEVGLGRLVKAGYLANLVSGGQGQLSSGPQAESGAGYQTWSQYSGPRRCWEQL